uniref:Putative conserved secreted protein n=1 Tax=Culex tarsalis TaxID=7177 RepID=A0A1Q3G000_CULTA
MKLLAAIWFCVLALLAGIAAGHHSCPANSVLKDGQCETDVIARGGCPDGFKYDIGSNKCRSAPAGH